VHGGTLLNAFISHTKRTKELFIKTKPPLSKQRLAFCISVPSFCK